MAKDRFANSRHRGQPTEEIRPSRDRYLDKGAQTHKKPYPVKDYTPEEIEKFKKERGLK